MNTFYHIVQGLISVNRSRTLKLRSFEGGPIGKNLFTMPKASSFLASSQIKTFSEPLACSGGFVTNTVEKIRQLYADYIAGKFVFGKNN